MFKKRMMEQMQQELEEEGRKPTDEEYRASYDDMDHNSKKYIAESMGRLGVLGKVPSRFKEALSEQHKDLLSTIRSKLLESGEYSNEDIELIFESFLDSLANMDGKEQESILNDLLKKGDVGKSMEMMGKGGMGGEEDGGRMKGGI